MKLIPIYYNIEYLNKIADWRNENKKHLRAWDDTSYSNQEKWVSKVISSISDNYYFIEDEKFYSDTRYDGEKCVLGYCGLDKVINMNRVAEISLLIGTEYQNKGWGKRVIKELLKKAFDEFNLNLVYAETYFNLKFWEKCGFKQEAILRQRKYWQNEYYDSHLLSITRSEFYDNS